MSTSFLKILSGNTLNAVIETLHPKDILSYYEWALKYGRRRTYRKEAPTSLKRCTVKDVMSKIGLYYGLRRSEILGLKWDAIDFEKKEIEIRHTVVRISNKPELRKQ